MKRKHILPILLFSTFVITSCNERGSQTDKDGTDTTENLMDTRRNTDDTLNFLEDTSENNLLDTSQGQ